MLKSPRIESFIIYLIDFIHYYLLLQKMYFNRVGNAIFYYYWFWVG